jgi:hypothetical protein
MNYIEVNGTIIDFDGTLSMVLNNPMFTDEISYSLQSTAPYTPNNAKAFGYVNRPDIADNKTKELPAKIVFGSLHYIGTVTVKYSGSAFSFYFKVIGDFYTAIKDKYLSEIPFDVVDLNGSKHYNEITDIMNQYRSDDCDQPFTFPILINKKISSKYSIVTPTNTIINSISTEDKQHAIIPFPFISYILKNIFEKNGLQINKNAIEKHKFLKRLVCASNYLINEFALNKTELSQNPCIICSIENSSDPMVTTVYPHGLANYSFIELIIRGTQIPQNKSRIYQIENVFDSDGVQDTKSFKLLNEDFSYLEESIQRPNLTPVTYEKATDNRLWLTKYISCHYDEGTLPEYNSRMRVYMYSDDFRGWVELIKPSETELIIYIYDINLGFDFDPDFDTHTYANLGFILPEGPYDTEIISIPPGNITYPILKSTDGSIVTLPNVLDCEFNKIDPANHMPYLKINDFLNDLKKIGIIAFVRQTGVDISLYKDIYSSHYFEDITDISSAITEIENADNIGFNLKFTTDSNDEYCKTMLPVSVIDSKYTIKDPVATKSVLTAVGSSTNDVRLVTDENAWYVFNKSFLNADNNWKLLCYNNIDLTEADGDYKIQTKLSPVIPGKNDIRIDEFDVPCKCNEFSNDVNMNFRLLSYYVLANNLETIYYATSETIGPDNSEIEGSELAIKWDGINGIRNVLLKEHLENETSNRKNCKSVVIWTQRHLNDFDFPKKYRIAGVNYLIPSIKFAMNFKTGNIVNNETALARV